MPPVKVLPEIWVIVPPSFGASIKVPLSTSIVPVLLSEVENRGRARGAFDLDEPRIVQRARSVDVRLRILPTGESRMVPPDWLLSTELECIWSSTPVAVTMSVPALFERQAIQESPGGRIGNRHRPRVRQRDVTATSADRAGCPLKQARRKVERRSAGADVQSRCGELNLSALSH